MSHKRQINHEDKDETPKQPSPYKKARYHWEIKRSKRQSCLSKCNDKSDNEERESSKSPTTVTIDEVNAMHCSKTFVDNDECEKHTPVICENDSNHANSENSCQLDNVVFHNTEPSSNTPNLGREHSDVKELPQNKEISSNTHTSEPEVIDSESHEHSSDAVSETLEDLTEYFPLPVGNSQDNSPNVEYHRWQNRHVAKGIVDNAINHTLEEMGICPKSLTRTVRRNFVESNAITAAIRSEGLQFGSLSSPEPVDGGNLDSDEDDDSIEEEFDNTCNLISTASQNSGSACDCDSDLASCFEQRQSSYLLDDAVSVAISSKGLMMRPT